MPQGDRTGPAGRGPMTGRGRGFCSGFEQPGFMNLKFGRGQGFGRGFGRGRGFGFRTSFYDQPYPEPAEPVTFTAEQKKKILEAEALEMEAELKAVKEKIKELK